MQRIENENKKLSKNKKGYLRYIGILLLLTGLVFLFATYKPLIFAYINYKFSPTETTPTIKISSDENEATKIITKSTETIFVDKDFGIYIPKIKANSKVISNVNPYDKTIYDTALEQGIAHAQGTSLPNQTGNTFLFAHSAVNFYEQRKYNVYFYLLNELEKGDPIYISYNSNIYKYLVLETKIVDSTDTKYMGKYMDKDTLTLMSCWPAGTNWKRIIVVAIRAI
jgi:sortase A